MNHLFRIDCGLTRTTQLYGSFELATDGKRRNLRANTPVGFYDVDGGRQYWQLTNRLGSVMALVDSDGNVQRRSGHYPGGIPFVLDGEDSHVPDPCKPDDRHHIGNRWVSFGGLDWYDNTARMHNPLLMRFTTPDPLASDHLSLSPWSHCAANPANIIDPTGRDLYKLAPDGTMSKIKSTSDNWDVIEGYNHNTITVSKSFISSEENVDFTYEYSKLDENANKVTYNDSGTCSYYKVEESSVELFTFLAENTNVEWTLVSSDTQGTFVGNSHKEDGDGTLDIVMRNNPNLTGLLSKFFHSHPTDDMASEKDTKLAKGLEAHSPNVECKIYHVNSRYWSTFNGSTHGINLSKIQVLPDAVVEGEGPKSH